MEKLSLRMLFFLLSSFLVPFTFLTSFHFLFSFSLSMQGRCVIAVQLTDEELAAEDEGVDYFLLFAGSTQRHLTSTLRSNHDTLHALCPGKPPSHNACSFPFTSNGPKSGQLHLQYELHVETIWNFAVMFVCVNWSQHSHCCGYPLDYPD